MTDGRMKSWRWDLIVAALLISLALVAHAMLPRYVPAGTLQAGALQPRPGVYTLDRWTGRTCSWDCGMTLDQRVAAYRRRAGLPDLADQDTIRPFVRDALAQLERAAEPLHMKLLYGALVVLVIFGTIRAFHVMFADMRSMREHQERKIRQRDVRKILDRDPD